MGLDQYAYVAAKAGANKEYWDSAGWDDTNKEYESDLPKPREIAYWRKHPNLHGWMENLWREQTGDSETMFNGVELELTWEDLERLKRDVERGILPETQGFFFGSNSDEDYLEDDLNFIKNAKADLFLGLKVFYNSSW